MELFFGIVVPIGVIIALILIGYVKAPPDTAYMISERNQMAEKYTADGNYEASIIRNDVDKQVNIIVSNAQAEAAKLEAEGEAEYMRLLAEAYNTKDKKDFYEFMLALDALKESLTGDNNTVILDEDSALAQILLGN